MRECEFQRLVIRGADLTASDTPLDGGVGFGDDIVALWNVVAVIAKEVRPDLFPPDPPPTPFDIGKAEREITELRSEIARLKEALNG